MTKNPAIQGLLDGLAKMMQAPLTPSEAKQQGACVKCGLPAAPRCTTEAGKREYEISAMCEVCWDAIFAGPEPGGSTEEDLVRAQQAEKGE